MRQTERHIRGGGEKRCRGSRKKRKKKRLGREMKDRGGQTGIAEKEGKAHESSLGAQKL